MSKITLNGIGLLHEGLSPKHEAAVLGEVWVWPDLGMALDDVVSQNGGVSLDEGDFMRISAGKRLSELDVIPRPLLRQG